ncbi:hypothetical protein EDEG_03049 [Edhazardia aedis USNM 41457]|uniref:Uncharacterized protein n=1 Tax=Edhazardia aedis (strain USNM 41457) TaxID=1003232 RepID=J9DME3_EDHAE|nr:hypothetical protein EDEG_03049 [Edhazardia aedis USNM 41457]|eukprot:EJW02537.1 hypothetical protein EDEG_03049 [Edhazardia aedis USNM 41457]
MQLFFIILTVFTSRNTKENFLEPFVDQFSSTQPVPSTRISAVNLSSQSGNTNFSLHEKADKFCSNAIQKKSHMIDTIDPVFQTEKNNGDGSFSNIDSLSKEKFTNCNSSGERFYNFYVPTDNDKIFCNRIEGSNDQNIPKFNKTLLKDRQECHNEKNFSNFSQSVGYYNSFSTNHLNAFEEKKMCDLENLKKQKKR